ncbi:PREDICTED: homeobox protein 6-like [Polistes canadensis]|uniref:homeobox protein 6-like n=1 Tax=Polistes canadensis TaxID=91411 RepID=UPI000718F0AC|nr:PREDICTED: homeobox protein 6-like [Polistes canadensis]
MFPIPMACQNIFKTTDVIDDTKKPNELYTRAVNDDCYYWFAKQTGNSVAKFSNGNTICTRPTDCIHHANEGEDCSKNITTTVANLSNIETILRRYNGKCYILINEDDQTNEQKYILIDTDNSDDNSSYVEEEDEDNDINNNDNDNDNDNIKVNENNHPYRNESSPKCSKE